MVKAQQGAPGAGWISKLVVVLLLALAIALYLKIVMVDQGVASGEAAPLASVRVLEGEETAAAPASPGLRDLPKDQMDLIERVFAPELQK